MNQNKIKHIPKEIGNLRNLKSLFLADNQEMGDLVDLQSLILQNNQVETIPQELRRIEGRIEGLIGKQEMGANAPSSSTENTDRKREGAFGERMVPPIVGQKNNSTTKESYCVLM